QRQAFRGGQGNPGPPTFDELEILDRAVRLHAADEAVVVFRRRAAGDVRGERDVLHGVVQHGFRREERLHRQDLRRRGRGRRWRRRRGRRRGRGHGGRG